MKQLLLITILALALAACGSDNGGDGSGSDALTNLPNNPGSPGAGGDEPNRDPDDNDDVDDPEARSVNDVTDGPSPPLSQVLLRCDEAGGLTGQTFIRTGAIPMEVQGNSEDVSDGANYATLRGDDADSVATQRNRPNCRIVTDFASDTDNYAGFGFRAGTTILASGASTLEERFREVLGAFQTTFEQMGILRSDIELPVFRSIDHPDTGRPGFQGMMIIRTTGNVRVTAMRNFIADQLTDQDLILPATPESGTLDDFLVNVAAFEEDPSGGQDRRVPTFYWFGVYPPDVAAEVDTARADLQTGVGVTSERER